jgi:hypothetical protein
MRGEDVRSGSPFSYVDLEARIGKNYPLHAIRTIVNEALAVLAGEFRRCIRRSGDLRFLLKSYCGRCCCNRSIRSARSGS